MEKLIILKGPHQAHCNAGEYCQTRINPHLLAVGFVCCCGFKVVEIKGGVVRLVKNDGSAEIKTIGGEAGEV